MQIEVRKADLLTFEGDGIVVPTVATGQMQTAIAARVLAQVGEEVQAEVIDHAPIAVGACLVTGGKPLPVRYLIHAPVIEEPGMRVGIESIRRSVRASLLGATRYEMQSIGIPGFGYDEAGVSHEETARAIIDEITGYKNSYPQNAVLLDRDEEMIEAFETQLASR